MDIPSSILMIVALANFLLGCLVYGKDIRGRTNILYALLAISVATWSISIYFFRRLSSLSLLSLWGDIAYVTAAASAFFFLYFSSFFTQRKKVGLFWNLVLMGILAGLFWLILGTDKIIKAIVVTEKTHGLLFGEGYILYSLFIFAFFGLGFFNLISKYLKSSGIFKAQLKYILLGSGLSVSIAIFTNLLLFGKGTFQYNWLGPSATVIMVIFIAYAITKHHLFRIKIIVTELLVGLVSLVVLVDMLLAKTPSVVLLKLSLLIAFLYLGWSLIKSVLKEIERRKQLEKLATQLRKANIKLRKLDQAKTEFLAVASHQLRTPLTAIRGYLSMLRRGDYGRLPTRFVDPLREVYQSTLRLGKLTNRLLDATRIETGRLKMNLGPVSLGGLISSIVDELKSQAKEKNLYLKFLKPKEKLPPLPLDLEKIRQVLLNIIDNGLKYTQKGGVEISLGLVGVDRVQIKVQDTGEGMTKEELKKIFRSFSRGIAGEKFHTAGAGLGLYIAKEFVELHQGKIWATSPGTGKGTTIWIELPLKSNQAKTEKDPTSFPGKKKKKLS